MEKRKGKLIVNKSGGTASVAGVTFRVTLPSSWIRKIGLSEDARNIKLMFDGQKIKIINNEEETKMLNNILEDAKIKIQEKMNKVGFVDDTDNAERFIDDLAREYEEEHDLDFDLILETLEDHMKKTYKRKGSCDKTGHYAGCYYKDKEGLKKWESIGE
ncbi:hypothetical protein SAMN05446037_100249 [Anaerovirgula multivorans]|uniref:SpoVT-AbrB domain-containing protein n=1 Tax=Anaerovirgula multivorans TaxID=312168 RepID=A0A239AHX8_9FIRM|nr:hypothetical protein [Anaerovirgula multivorans]SNR95140.1 hypothetical protein SAMN05446037_100249 [Anaerovirgula multivorans]